jgi:membrane associated rhomboid family serine protease
MYQEQSSPRLTPWVVRLLAANAVVLLLQETLFTSPAITAWLRFDPDGAFQRPWTFFSYMLLHGGLFHLLANSIALFVFGPPVERRMGSSRFLLYYVYCGLGAAVLSLVLAAVMPISPFIGASGAVLGVAVAFARFYPDAELVLFPIPIPIKAKVLVWLFAAMAVLGALLGSGDGIAHIAHLGGLLFGLLYFAAKGISAGPQRPEFLPTRPRVPVGAGKQREVSRSDGATATAPKRRSESQPSAPPSPDPAALEKQELDRVLDKISATGIASLAPEEKAFLDGVAKRRKGS